VLCAVAHFSHVAEHSAPPLISKSGVIGGYGGPTASGTSNACTKWYIMKICILCAILVSMFENNY
jgi:hypothetical protein